MGEFTAKSALLTGVDLMRRRPLLILLWVALLMAWSVASSITFQTFQAWRSAGIAAGRPPSSLLGQSLVYTTSMTVATMVVQGVLWAWAFRAFAWPTERAPKALGRKELAAAASVVIVQLVVAAISGALIVFISDWVIRAAGLIAVGPMTQAPSAALGTLGIYWAAVAGVWAYARGEIALVRCWTLTRGRFWTVTGLAAGIAAIAYVLRAADRALIGMLTHQARLPAMTLQTLVGTPIIFVTLAGALITVLQMAFIAGIVVSAYRASHPEPQAASVSAGSAAPAS
jgi:hypothetical protein